MKPLTISELVTAAGAELIGTDSGVLVSAVSTDTRSLGAGSLFIALRGDNFDGHAFIDTAVENGAACLMLDELPEGREFDVPVLLVKNTLYGLQRLAKWYRQHLDIKVIGITGSNGKTSTKDFVASVLSQQFEVNATKGNLNNHIGLPLSVLATEESDQVCVWEMGMNHPGEIAPLCEIAAPDIGIITNIGTAHIENLGTREAIAEEKGSLARALHEEGTLIVPAVCDFVDYLIERTRAKVMVVGNGRGVVRAEELKMTAKGSSFKLCIGDVEEPVEIPVSGKHMVNNALLAAASGHALGMTPEKIAEGLAETSISSGRLRRYNSGGVTVIDDTYNANPESMAAAIETLADLHTENGSRKVVVMGMMAELGNHTDPAHLKVGKLAAEKHLQVVSVGSEAAKIYQGANEVNDTAKHFENADAAADWIKDYCREGDLILFKGSRMAAMENVMSQAFPED
ncbi:MAG: UDP-N-acetylmuramoyl-tripeptide--D-alanyl-D-alanine ligase [Akkermansiaceae bacterium]